MKAIKAILTFVMSVIKSIPVQSKSKNGFMIYKAIKPEHYTELERLCAKAEWTCKQWPAVVNQSTGEVISDARVWFGIQSAAKDVSIDELMKQASEVSAKE
tara:strand:+ start:163 stop:465 length:303 start_codon:yes stop_codon:yes gene_type:complete